MIKRIQSTLFPSNNSLPTELQFLASLNKLQYLEFLEGRMCFKGALKGQHVQTLSVAFLELNREEDGVNIRMSWLCLSLALAPPAIGIPDLASQWVPATIADHPWTTSFFHELSSL